MDPLDNTTQISSNNPVSPQNIPTSNLETSQEEQLQRNNQEVAKAIKSTYPKALADLDLEIGTAIFMGQSLRGVSDSDYQTAELDQKSSKKTVDNLLNEHHDIAIVFSKEGVTVMKNSNLAATSNITIDQVGYLMSQLRDNPNKFEPMPEQWKSASFEIPDKYGDIDYIEVSNKPEGFFASTLPPYLTTSSVRTYLKLVQAKEERMEKEKKTPEKIIAELT